MNENVARGVECVFDMLFFIIFISIWDQDCIDGNPSMDQQSGSRRMSWVREWLRWTCGQVPWRIYKSAREEDVWTDRGKNRNGDETISLVTNIRDIQAGCWMQSFHKVEMFVDLDKLSHFFFHLQFYFKFSFSLLWPMVRFCCYAAELLTSVVQWKVELVLLSQYKI